MPYAKENLHDGLVLIASKGTYISDEAVKAHGWEDKVEAGPDPVANQEEQPDEAPKPTRNRRAS